MSKQAKILIIDITYSYGNKTGDEGAREFLDAELEKNEFDLTKPYTKRVDKINGLLICEQE